MLSATPEDVNKLLSLPADELHSKVESSLEVALLVFKLPELRQKFLESKTSLGTSKANGTLMFLLWYIIENVPEYGQYSAELKSEVRILIYDTPELYNALSQYGKLPNGKSIISFMDIGVVITVLKDATTYQRNKSTKKLLALPEDEFYSKVETSLKAARLVFESPELRQRFLEAKTIQGTLKASSTLMFLLFYLIEYPSKFEQYTDTLGEEVRALIYDTPELNAALWKYDQLPNGGSSLGFTTDLSAVAVIAVREDAQKYKDHKVNSVSIEELTPMDIDSNNNNNYSQARLSSRLGALPDRSQLQQPAENSSQISNNNNVHRI